MDDIITRKLSADELLELTKLFNYNDINDMIRDNSRLIKNRSIDIFGTFMGGELIAEMRVKYRSRDSRCTKKGRRAYLYAFRVSESHQGVGIGKQLLARVLDELAQAGYNEFTVGVEPDNEVAKHIYHQAGFNDRIAVLTDSYQGDNYTFDLLLKVNKFDPLAQRIMIIGSGGSGKSTLSVELGKMLNLRVVHMDKLHWHKWKATPSEEFREKLSNELDSDNWIVDGNYVSTMDLRAERCDSVIYLDFSKWLCLYRVIKRRIQHSGRVRPDMGEGCIEKVDLEFLIWIYRFPHKSKPNIIATLRKYNIHNVITLKNPKDVADLLASIQQNNTQIQSITE